MSDQWLSCLQCYRRCWKDNFVQLHIAKAVLNAVAWEEPRLQQLAVSLMQFGNLFQFAMKCRSLLMIKCDYVWHDVTLAGEELESCEGAGSVRDHISQQLTRVQLCKHR